MAEAGADLIIGTHPHVLQPLKYIETKDQRTVPVYYSLGNFISAQNKDPRMLGGMAKVIITDNNGQITLDCVNLLLHILNLKTLYCIYVKRLYWRFRYKHKQGLTLDYLYNLYNDIVEDKDNRTKRL